MGEFTAPELEGTTLKYGADYNIPKSEMIYPNIRVLHEYPVQLPIILDTLGEGDCSIQIIVDGSPMHIGSVPLSVKSFAQIVRLWPIEIQLSAADKVRIDSVSELYPVLNTLSDKLGFLWTV